MSDLAPPIIPPIVQRKSPQQPPGFLQAWRGIWLMTWASQFTWRRLPVQLLSLLVLPVLVYITTSTPESWALSHSLLGDFRMQVVMFGQQLHQARLSLQPEQRNQLRQIFQEEFDSANSAGRGDDAAQPDVAQRNKQIAASYARIHDRVKLVLDENQFAVFQTFERNSIQASQARASEAEWSWTAPFHHWLIDFYFFIMLPLTCVQLCGGLIRNELQADTLGFLTTRPLSRARLLIIKYLSQTAWLQMLLLVETVLLFSAGFLRQIPSLGTLFPLFLAAQFLAVFAWSALGIFLGQVSNRYIAVALVYGVIVELGIGRIPTNINTLSLMRHLKTLLAHNPALQNIYEWTGTGVPFSVVALVLATGIFLALAALLFTFLEYHYTTEMQK